VTDSASIWIEHSWGSTWNAGLGARWVHELRAGYPGGLEYGYRLPVPLSVLEWRPWTDHSFSLSYGMGYRSGGLTSPETAFVPERSRNIEFAWRAQWLGGSLHTALSAFDNEIRDRFTYSTAVAGNLGLASVRDRGLEFELTADLSDRWRLRAGVGVLNSHYSSSLYRYRDPTSEAPPQTATLGVHYGLGEGWYGALDAYRAADAEYDISDQPAGHFPSYGVLNLRVGFRTANRDIALIAANALDTQYVERIEKILGQSGYRLGDPRRVELRVKWTW
jgi:outer membrane receptor protein involved in Fe transport